MEMMPVKPERKAQLEAYAKDRGQSAADVLDEMLAEQLEWRQREYDDPIQAARHGYADVKAGRTKPA